MSRRKLPGTLASILFLYLLFGHYTTFATFWTDVTRTVDPSGNAAGVLMLLTPAIIAMLVGLLLDEVLP